MKHFLSCLVPVLLSACMVDTPVVEGNDDSLGENLAARCESLCRRAAECEAADDPETCPADCAEYFNETFVGKGAVCSEAAGRVFDCFDTESCSELTTGEACNITAEEELCFESQGLTRCYGGSTGGGSDGYCDVSFEDCWNGRTFRLTCLGDTDPPECDCSVDGDVTGTFIRTLAECPEEFEAKEICGFPVADTPGEPATRPRASCEAGGSASNGGGSFYECEASFEGCSDGHYYEVLCEGPPGAVDCYCSIDGEHVDQNQSPAGICPFLDDPDGGAVAINYVCGFSILPPTFP
jgi:hypothetical protein